jgi:hypothetical protein
MSTIVFETRPAKECGASVFRDGFGPEHFPRDLAEWMSPVKLQTLAQRLAQRRSNQVVPVFSFREQRMANPWRLLALWLYATARGVCRPEAIQRFAMHDAAARELCDAKAPSPDVIARFGELNAKVLLLRLEELLATACLYAQHEAPFARCFEAYLTGTARAEAEARLGRADRPGFPN